MSKPERDKQAGPPVPGFTEELRTRLSAVIAMIGSQKAAAEVAGVTDEQVGRWKAGRARMPLAAATALARAADVSLDWLATGKGPMRPEPPQAPKPPLCGVDAALMKRIASAIEEVYRQENAAVTPLQLVDLAAAYYADLEVCESDQEREGALKVLLSQLRRQLRETPGRIGAQGRGHPPPAARPAGGEQGGDE